MEARRLSGWLVGLMIAALPLATSATTSLAELPPPAYQLIAHAEGIPSHVLYSVALTESALRRANGIRPWPWTLNVAGEPRRYATRAEACNGLHQALQEVPAKRIDVGLVQTNWGYHGKRFESPCHALDPYQNLQVAARLLREHYEVTGNWLQAVGRYHRPAGGEPAARYRKAFSRQFARVMGIPTDRVEPTLDSIDTTKVASR